MQLKLSYSDKQTNTHSINLLYQSHVLYKAFLESREILFLAYLKL